MQVQCYLEGKCISGISSWLGQLPASPGSSMAYLASGVLHTPESGL